MEGLQPGTVTIKADADGYMLHVQTVDVRAREDSKTDVTLFKRPKKGDVEIAGNEIKIKRQIHFETDSAKISLDSTSLLEEIADTMIRNPCLKQIEIQGHTDNTGAKEHNKVLSDQRANAVREWLLAHSIEPGRLVAQGYGQERPISPNVTPAGKERNRRVQFMIKDQDKNCGGNKSRGRAGTRGPGSAPQAGRAEAGNAQVAVLSTRRASPSVHSSSPRGGGSAPAAHRSKSGIGPCPRRASGTEAAFGARSQRTASRAAGS